MVDFEKEIKRQENAEEAAGFYVAQKVKVPNEAGVFEDWIVAVVDKNKIELGKVGDDRQTKKVTPKELRAWQEQARKGKN